MIEASQFDEVKVIFESRMPAESVNRSGKHNVEVGALLGLMLGFFGAFFIETVEDDEKPRVRIRTEER